jgi:hypothetical protein
VRARGFHLLVMHPCMTMFGKKNQHGLLENWRPSSSLYHHVIVPSLGPRDLKATSWRTHDQRSGWYKVGCDRLI